MARRTSGYRSRFPLARTARSAASRARYSAEQHSSMTTFNSMQVVSDDLAADIIVVPSTNTQGMRKAKNFTCTVNITSTVASAVIPALPYVWALVYVPAGTTATAPNVTGVSLYEPNQFVIACGAGDLSSQPLRVFTPLARNLNSGDSVQLVVRFPFANTFDADTKGKLAVQALCRYAITLQ